MKRTSSALKSIATAIVVLVLAAVPAAASGEKYQSINSIVGGSGTTTNPVSHPADYSSINATLNESTPATTPAYRSINSIVGGAGTVPEQVTTVVHDRGGFDWDSALVGAGVALSVALLSYLSMYALRRRRGLAARA